MSTSSRIYRSFNRNDLLLYSYRAPQQTIAKRDAPVKVVQAYSGEETQTVCMGTIKRLLHRYLEHRNKWRTFQRACAENDIVVFYEGRRWCDATERELIGDIRNGHRLHL